MAESQDDDGLSTVNTNVTVAANHRLESYEDHQRSIIIKGLEESRDLVVMTNRINEEYGSVTGIDTITENVAVIYCDNY